MEQVDKEIEQYVLQRYSWENLPVDTKRIMSTKGTPTWTFPYQFSRELGAGCNTLQRETCPPLEEQSGETVCSQRKKLLPGCPQV
jgi:hypothetical protein